MTQKHIPDFAKDQDFHTFLRDYLQAYPDDALTIREEVSADQDPTSIVWELALSLIHI